MSFNIINKFYEIFERNNNNVQIMKVKNKLSDYILEDEENKSKTGKKVRNDATYNKDYLTGRYSAITVLEEFDISKY